MNDAWQSRGLTGAVSVRRELVHRRSPAEVLLTEVAARAENRFAASAYWPRSHPTFDRLGDGRHNPLLIAETVRQLGMCIPLSFYPCDERAHFLIEELNFGLDPNLEPRADHGGSPITCDVELDELRVGGGSGSLRAFRLRADLVAEQGVFATADGHARVLTESAYAALRRRAPSPSSDGRSPKPGKSAGPDQVGVAQASDVLVALGADGSISLHPSDALHPFFYDHACDHVPGMVLIEAARQAAAVTRHEPRLRPTSCALSAPAFTETTPAAQITCASERRRHVVTFRQNGIETAQVTLGR
ncbi:MAG TPA: ScbA/BarX family gamma-butyrolactone biosynthesis protein [Actinospica sp.]|nr:ScbA/BarX family gamma-butyrolactone biosynthesis protein [Actinospica sp.]